MQGLKFMMKRYRKNRNIDYKPVIFLVSEGRKTEPQYISGVFKEFGFCGRYAINYCGTKENQNTPVGLLKRAKSLIPEIKSSLDQIWILVDKDNNSNESLEALTREVQKIKQCYCAISNPCFEYWLLSHFQNVTVNNVHDCFKQLSKYLPEYDKSIKIRYFTRDKVLVAIKRNKERANACGGDFINHRGSSIYILLESLLNSSSS